MRKRIKAIARGKFEYAKPELIFSEKTITFSVAEGEVYQGEFYIENTANRKLRGLVYATHPRMEVITQQFEGERVRIRYQFKSNGLSEGLTEKGNFVIICEQNEVSLSFCVSISKKYAETSIGTVKNLYDFACLARENWAEAYQMFYHKNFPNLMKPSELKETMIYKGIIAAKPSNQNLEEFLIDIRKKEKIHFTIDRTQIAVQALPQQRIETVELKKDNWGYFEIHVFADADFIRLKKNRICVSDFVGNTCAFEFVIDTAYMHAGKNFAKIEFVSAYETMTVEIIADALTEATKTCGKNKKEALAKVMELYQDYRLKRIVTGVWAKETIAALAYLQELEPEENMYTLMKAHVFLINRQKQEAEWMLGTFKQKWKDKTHPLWGYYLYIRTLVEREPGYVRKLEGEIENIFQKNPDSPLLFWVLTFLSERYLENPALKWKEIAEWVMQGYASPYLYIEAFSLILEDSCLLMQLGNFELRLLRWAVKHQALNEDIALRIFQLMETKKGFHKVYYELMCAAYEVNPKEEYVGIICGYLIRGQQFDYLYHHWFALGIKNELRITSLYEAYLLSMNEHEIEAVPKAIQMYFQYESSLPYSKMAVLYRNIIAAKKHNKTVYECYASSMYNFAVEQVRAGHINTNLAVIYEDMLSVEKIEKETAKALSKIIFTHQLKVYDDKIIRAWIYQQPMKEPQVVSMIDHTAYVQLYAKDYVIVFEDVNGQHYSGTIRYQLQRLMHIEKYLPKCISLAPEALPFLLAYFDTKHNYLTFQKEDKALLQYLMNSELVDVRYKTRILPEILRFYQMNGEADAANEYLLHAAYDCLEASERKFVLEQLIESHLFAFAYEKLQEYGIDQISLASKAILAEHLITQMEFKEDTIVLQLAYIAFRAKKYNEQILTYLCRYFSGSTRDMLDIWLKAETFEIERSALSERILVQMMYADHMVLEGMAVFCYFYENVGDDLITLAYLSACAQYYFVEDKKIHEDLLRLMEARYIHHLEMNDICKLTLLKYYSQLTNVSWSQMQVEDELLAEFTRRNMYFAFYKRLHPDLVLKYHLYDKEFLEYRTKPQSHVVLHYSRDEEVEDFIKEDMQDMYGGIFVKAFVMFFGESVQYYITEENRNEVEVTESSRIVNNDVYNKNDSSRYHLLNQMLVFGTLQEDKELHQTMKQYMKYEEMTRKVFKIL